jgi:hypothetical protein
MTTPFVLTFTLSKQRLDIWTTFFKKYWLAIIGFLLTTIAITAYLIYWHNGLGLAYNDARSHLDIGRRVVEGLKPGLAQVGSVWLPLPHLLMLPTIWFDPFWHSGLSGALQSMIAFVATGLLIIFYLKRLKVGWLGQLVGLAVFITNPNILYLQSTAMTELLLVATLLAGAYELLCWSDDDNLLHLLKAALWIMLSTLIRYDGWFLLLQATLLIVVQRYRKYGFRQTEGVFFLFTTFAGVGVVLWVLWNLAIFHDPFYFALGPYSAHAQQEQIESAGMLLTKGNILLSTGVYSVATLYNVGFFTLLLGVLGLVLFFFDKKIFFDKKLMATALLSPFLFNIVALVMGHSVLFIPGVFGYGWFNIRYGIMLIPAVAIGIGYLIDRSPSLRWVIIGLLLFVTFFMYTSHDAVTIDDASVGSSQKNVSEVSGWLKQNVRNTPGFVLISAASHDAIIFSSGLPMKRFIHEGTGKYWENATTAPDRWARWIIMRTNDESDQTFRLVNASGQLYKYDLINSFPFADIYQLKPEYLGQLTTEIVPGINKP